MSKGENAKMKRQQLLSRLFLMVILVLFFVAAGSGCSQGKYAQFKGKEYQTSWTQMNDFVIKNKGKDLKFEDIKRDYLMKAVLYELVRRVDNPDKTSPVETMSKSEEELILKGWKRVINETLWDEDYFVFFADNLELAAQLLQDSGFDREGGFKKAAHYVFYTRREFDQALEFLLKNGFSIKEAADAIEEPMRVSGSGGGWFMVDHEDKMIAYLLRTGKSKTDALDMVGSAVSAFYIGKLHYDNPTEEEAVKIVEQTEQKVMALVKDEKWMAKLVGKAFLRNDMPERAVAYLEKSEDAELLKELYGELGNLAFRKDDYPNALKYYEKAGDNERVQEIKEYLRKIGKQ